MNTSNSPSPLVPQGSMLEKNAGRSRVKLAFFCVVGVHVAGLMVLLMQGCKREPTPGPDANPPPIVPAIESNAVPVDVGSTGAPPTGDPGGNPIPIDQPPPPPPPPPQSNQEYAVQSGDSYSTIAKKFPGVTAKAIQDANPTVNPLKLQVSQKLVIPPPAVKTVPANGTGTEVVPATGEIIHTVKSNETLGGIASKYKTTVKAIQEANNISDADIRKIQVGKKLKIPMKAAPPPAPQ